MVWTKALMYVQAIGVCKKNQKTKNVAWLFATNLSC